jgi:hypothetical protein
MLSIDLERKGTSRHIANILRSCIQIREVSRKPFKTHSFLIIVLYKHFLRILLSCFKRARHNWFAKHSNKRLSRYEQKALSRRKSREGYRPLEVLLLSPHAQTPNNPLKTLIRATSILYSMHLPLMLAMESLG